MRRWVLFSICAFLGLALLVCGLLVPAHLRAIDAGVVQQAGKKTATLVSQGLALAKDKKLGAAQMLLQAAQQEGLADSKQLEAAVGNLAKRSPDLFVHGSAEPRLKNLFKVDSKKPVSGPEPITEFVVRLDNRSRVLDFLQASPRPIVQELLRCRELTNTVLFPPSMSSSGQAFDAAVSVCGLLLEQGRLTQSLNDSIAALVSDANRGGSPQPLEEMLLDLMSLGQRFNWDQMAAFVSQIQDVETLRSLVNEARNAGAQLPVLFAAVQLSGRPGEVARYLNAFSQTGLKDLGAGLCFGAGGVNELLHRNQRLAGGKPGEPAARKGDDSSFLSELCLLLPGLGLTLKWLLYLASGFLLATSAHFARPAVSVLERPLQVPGFHVAREILFALGFLLVILLVSEPFLAQESQKAELPFRLHLPGAGSIMSAGTTNAHPSIMNQLSLLTLLLFFVLQALIYTACRVKLAEIRRQNITARLKLKLLENEDHLFDAGLYLGFVGTIISLILVSLGVIKPSLMAAYSSTSFGIIFVSAFKIFHLRPVRRNLLLEVEAASPEPAAPATQLS